MSPAMLNAIVVTTMVVLAVGALTGAVLDRPRMCLVFALPLVAAGLFTIGALLVIAWVDALGVAP